MSDVARGYLVLMRAELAGIRTQAATRCPHHINRTRGRCVDCDRAETSEEIADA